MDGDLGQRLDPFCRDALAVPSNVAATRATTITIAVAPSDAHARKQPRHLHEHPDAINGSSGRFKIHEATGAES